MAELQPSPSINDARAQALLHLIGRLRSIDLTPLLVYRIDSVPAAALPFLGWQFDLLSPLWALLAPTNPQLSRSNEATVQRRALIKAAIPLHRIRGTPASIKQALTALGWFRATILEGQKTWGGTAFPPNEGWAVCRLLIPIPAFAPNTVVPWLFGVIYPAGSIVSYNRFYFWASDVVPFGVAPMFADGDDVTDWDSLTDIDHLVPAPWIFLGTSPPLRPVGPNDAATIIALFEFFKPERCWLDSVWFIEPPLLDDAPVPRDILTVGGPIQYQSDRAPVPSDSLFLAIRLPPLADSYAPIVPLYNNHYRHSGITHGVNEPLVADSALILNGQAVLEGG